MSTAQLIAYGLPFFEGLSSDALEGLSLKWSEHRYKSGNTVMAQDSDDRDVMFLLSGDLLAVYWTEDGREIVFTRFPVGSCFGELSAIDGHPRSLAIYAKSPARVLRLEQASFRQLMDQVPLFRARVMTHLVSRIRSLTRKTTELTTYTIEQRVCSYLIALALETNRLKAGGTIERAPTHAEIASTIGANREMVSRTISSLARRGVIQTGRQRIQIINPDALADAI